MKPFEIVKKFPKTELMKVELGLTQDVLQIYNALTKVKEKMDTDVAKAKKAAIIGDGGIGNFYKKAEDIERLAKELGIPVSDINLQKLFLDIKEYQKSFDEVIRL